MIRMTASGLARAEECIGSVVLPQISEGGKWAATGSAVDRFVQTAKTRDKALALAEAPAELRPYLDALTLDRIPDGAEYQVAFAFNVITGEARCIPGRGEGYPDGFGDEWIFGTSDIVGVRDGRVIVIDLKWGSYTIGRDPATDLQLGFYAISAATIAGVDEAEVGFSRAGWDAVLRPDSAVLDSLDLAALRARIVAVWERARATSAPSLRVGEWCGYCPARRNCDAMVQPTALMLRGDLAALADGEAPAIETIRDRISALSAEQRGRVYEVCGEVEERAKLVRNVIRDDAKQAPIPLSSGKELRLVQWGARRSSDVAKAREAALEDELRAAGEVQTVKVPQVRPMAVRR